eukprot:3767908-Rhodomonas_salina.2
MMRGECIPRAPTVGVACPWFCAGRCSCGDACGVRSGAGGVGWIPDWLSWLLSTPSWSLLLVVAVVCQPESARGG